MIILISVVLVPLFSFANGGDQRIVEGKFYINLSRAPFTPHVGIKTSFLASFVDLKTNNLFGEDLVVRVRISKLARDRKFVFEQGNLRVKGGVLELQYTFSDAGLHEIFFDFALASNPEEIYEAPDFLIDVQERKNNDQNSPPFLGVGGGLLLGLIAGWFIGRRMKNMDKGRSRIKG